MKSGMTRAEHNVAAALMGKVYDWRDHTYFDVDVDGEILDADTCHPIADYSHIHTRKMAVNREEIGCDDGPFTLTPAS